MRPLVKKSCVQPVKKLQKRFSLGGKRAAHLFRVYQPEKQAKLKARAKLFVGNRGPKVWQSRTMRNPERDNFEKAVSELLDQPIVTARKPK